MINQKKMKITIVIMMIMKMTMMTLIQRTILKNLNSNWLKEQ